jgi:hypothetical protein
MAESPENNRENLNELSVERAAKLLFLSFRFSQGNSLAQHRIFEWLRLNYPDYRILEKDCEAVLSRAIEIAKSFFNKQGQKLHVNIEPDIVKSSLESELGKMQRLFKGRNLNSSSLPNSPIELEEILEKEKTILGSLLDVLTEVDIKNINKGRTRYTGYQSNKVETDPRASFLVDYGLLGNSTGATEYDNMFKQIKDYIKLLKGSSDPKNQKIINNILGVIKLYNRHHPNKRVDLTQVLNQ